MMSEDTASNINSRGVENEATQLSDTYEERDMNNLNESSSSNCVTLIDSVNVASKTSNHIDMKVNNQNNLDLCSDEEDWDNDVNVIVEGISPPPSCVNDSKGVSNQNAKGEEVKKRTSVNYYVVSNENTAEPFQTSGIVEDGANLDTYRDSIIEATDDSDSSDSESSSTVSEDDDDIDDDDSDNNSLGYD